MSDENRLTAPMPAAVPPKWLSPRGAMLRLSQTKNLPEQAEEKLISAVHQGEIAHRVNGFTWNIPTGGNSTVARASGKNIFISASNHPQVGRVIINDWTTLTIDWRTGDFSAPVSRIVGIFENPPIEGWIQIWWADVERVLGRLCRPKRTSTRQQPPAPKMSVEEAAAWIERRFGELSGRIKRDELIQACIAAAKAEGKSVDRETVRKAYSQFAAAQGLKVGRPRKSGENN